MACGCNDGYPGEEGSGEGHGYGGNGEVPAPAVVVLDVGHEGDVQVAAGTNAQVPPLEELALLLVGAAALLVLILLRSA